MTAADQVAQDTAAAQVVADMALNDEVVTAPVAGQEESLTAVNDPVFSTKAMGNGAAIIPSSNQIVAPVDGEITVAYETKHAYGLKSDDGAEVLIHIGIDTVNLKGDHFTSAVQQGQHVKQGDVLGTADIDAIKQAGYDPTVMVVITNTNNYANVERIDATAVQAGDNLIALTKRN